MHINSTNLLWIWWSTVLFALCYLGICGHYIHGLCSLFLDLYIRDHLNVTKSRAVIVQKNEHKDI